MAPRACIQPSKSSPGPSPALFPASPRHNLHISQGVFYKLPLSQRIWQKDPPTRLCCSHFHMCIEGAWDPESSYSSALRVGDKELPPLAPGPGSSKYAQIQPTKLAMVSPSLL